MPKYQPSRIDTEVAFEKELTKNSSATKGKQAKAGKPQEPNRKAPDRQFGKGGEQK